MRKLFVVISIFIISCMVGCGSKEPLEYMQSQLPKPDRIEVRRDDNPVYYDMGSDKYDEIYEALSKNWWKTSENKSYSISEQEFVEVKNLKDERTTSKMRYASDVEACIRFLYEEESLNWTKSSYETVAIGEINFILPHYPIENEQTKGHYVVFQAERPGVNEGLYYYYFSNELFEALSETDETVSTNYNDKPTEIDLQYFSNLVYEEVCQKLIELNNWTHLEKNQLYWNPDTKQLVINHIFSKKANERELLGARDYWETIEILRHSWSLSHEISHMFNDVIPENAEVIMQVYVGDELVSQDIYGDVEENIIYKVVRYKK